MSPGQVLLSDIITPQGKFQNLIRLKQVVVAFRIV
jgi:hypothetical protein